MQESVRHTSNTSLTTESTAVSTRTPFFETGSNHYTICAFLNGCFRNKGRVLLAKHNSSGYLVSIKHFNFEDFDDDLDYEAAINEILHMRQFKHPNIISCLTTFSMNYDLYIVSPFMNFTSCRDLLSVHFPDGLPEVIISRFLHDVLLAVEYIHSKGYIHRAIKARHILIRADGQTCLSGLRYMYPAATASSMNNSADLNKVFHLPIRASHNLNWCSPELLEQNSHGYGQKTDIYSIGITACELANGVVPFAEISTTLMLTEKVRGVTPQLIDCTTWFLYENDTNGSSNKDLHLAGGDESFIESNERRDNVKMSRRFSDAFHAFVELCSHNNLMMRPTSSQLLKHSFLKQSQRSNVNVQELLKPAVPLTESNTAGLSEDLTCLNYLTCNFTDTTVACDEWNF